jgi:hypothetical protein
MNARKNPAGKKAVGANRERFVVEFCAMPGVNAIRALRQLLKFALRTCGLKCIRITRERKAP